MNTRRIAHTALTTTKDFKIKFFSLITTQLFLVDEPPQYPHGIFASYPSENTFG